MQICPWKRGSKSAKYIRARNGARSRAARAAPGTQLPVLHRRPRRSRRRSSPVLQKIAIARSMPSGISAWTTRARAGHADSSSRLDVAEEAADLAVEALGLRRQCFRQRLYAG